MRKKILTIFSIIFFIVVIFNCNDVFGVGIISKVWKNDSSGKPYLLYRLYTAAYPGEVKVYHGRSSTDLVEGGGWTYSYNGMHTSKWVYRNISMSYPFVDSYATIGSNFHYNKLCDYNAPNTYIMPYNTTQTTLTNDIATITSAYANSYVSHATPTTIANFENQIFYTLSEANGNFYTTDWGTGYVATNMTASAQTEYRYAIVNLDGKNIYVSDKIIDSNNIANFIQAFRAGNPARNECYVSDIVISRSKHSTSEYEVAKTTRKFFEQYNKGFGGWGVGNWYNYASKGMGSVANLYDNKLELPAFSKRTVLVRHIDIGSNTTISTEIVRNATRIPAINPPTLIATHHTRGNRTVTGSVTSPNYTGYEEYYEGLLDIEEGVSKSALSNTTTYSCLGYNVGVANSVSGAQQTIDTLIAQGKYTSGTTATVAGKTINDNDDVIIIDFYYTEYESDVQVNHLYVDQDGYVRELDKQIITPNSNAMEVKDGRDIKTINRTNTDPYIVEKYRKRKGINIRARIADSLLAEITDGNIIYMGFETFTSPVSVSSIIGTQRTGLNKTSQTAQLTSTIKQINFYYYLNNEIEEQEPAKDVDGKLFIETSNTESLIAECDDTGENIKITSIPSGSKAKVGITGVPKYMVGAITSQYNSPVHNINDIDITLTFRLGEQTKTVEYKDLQYRVGFYKITDMVVYRLKSEEIYDAGNGYLETVGESIFDWPNNKQTVYPSVSNLNIELKGINGRTIANNSTAIGDINNYVAINVEDSKGRKTTTGTSISSLDRTYLTTYQLNEVDANGDGDVTEADKTYAINKLQEYADILANKKEVQQQKQEEYDAALKSQNEYTTEMNAITTNLNTLKTVYDEAEKEKDKRLDAANKAKADLENLESQLEQRELELEDLKLIESEKLEEMNNAQINLDIASSERDRLKQLYLDSIALRNELAAKANCKDEIEIDPEEVEAVEQCKNDKAAYNQNLEDQTVENAKEIYERSKKQFRNL